MSINLKIQNEFQWLSWFEWILWLWGKAKNYPKRRRKRCSKPWPAWLVKTLNVLEVTDNPANAGEHTCCHLLKAQKWRWWCEELHFVWNSAAFLVPKKRDEGVRAAPAAQQIESGINVTTHQKKHGPSISANFSFTVKEEKIGLLQVHKSYHFCYW